MKNFQDPISRKQDLMLKELDAAFSWYQHVEGQISNWRALTITVLLGYIGFLFTVKVSDNAMIVPLIVIQIPFLLLEIYKRAHLVFLSENIEVIERIFTLTKEAQFLKEVRDFEFRDQRLKYYRVLTPKGILLWLKLTLLGFINLDAIIWYAIIIVSATIAYIHFRL